MLGGFSRVADDFWVASVLVTVATGEVTVSIGDCLKGIDGFLIAEVLVTALREWKGIAFGEREGMGRGVDVAERGVDVPAVGMSLSEGKGIGRGVGLAVGVVVVNETEDFLLLLLTTLDDAVAFLLRC